MKFKFYDHTNDETLLEVKSPNEPFAMNIFNLFMVEMVELHGRGFTKLGSDANNGVIMVTYTNNIVCVIEPHG